MMKTLMTHSRRRIVTQGFARLPRWKPLTYTFCTSVYVVQSILLGSPSRKIQRIHIIACQKYVIVRFKDASTQLYHCEITYSISASRVGVWILMVLAYDLYFIWIKEAPL